MTKSQIKEALTARGYTIRADRYLQKNLGNGWYVMVDTETNEVDAGHITQLPITREAHLCYEYNVSNHTGFKLDGITAVKNYVRNKEARKVPNHIIVGWAELLERRLK
jgi:hypothetical protein